MSTRPGEHSRCLPKTEEVDELLSWSEEGNLRVLMWLASPNTFEAHRVSFKRIESVLTSFCTRRNYTSFWPWKTGMSFLVIVISCEIEAFSLVTSTWILVLDFDMLETPNISCISIGLLPHWHLFLSFSKWAHPVWKRSKPALTNSTCCKVKRFILSA